MSNPVFICEQCIVLTRDVLLGISENSQRWQMLQSEHAKIAVFREHHSGQVNALKQSARAGCRLCQYIEAKVDQLRPSPAPISYCLFVQRLGRRTTEVQIGVSEIGNYLRPYEELAPSEVLYLFGQPTASPRYRDLQLEQEDARPARPHLWRLPCREPGLDRDIAEVRQWLAECQNTHAKCRTNPMELPTRLVDLRDYQTHGTVALRNTADGAGPYMAISYTWGDRYRIKNNSNLLKDEITPKYPHLNSSNIIEQQDLVSGPLERPAFAVTGHYAPDKIPIDIFPRVLADVLHVVFALDHRYVWVDCLCILQDSDADWIAQGERMTEIYQGAVLTIAATDAEHNGIPIMVERPNERIAIGSWHRGLHLNEPYLDIFAGDEPSGMDLEDHFLSTRGWIFQERLVAPRTLHYMDHGKVWECRTTFKMDHDQPFTEPDWKDQWRNLMHAGTDARAAQPARSVPTAAHFDVWHNWMAEYAAKNLYDRHDKFPAMAGLARTFAKAFGLDHDSYVAGLWRKDFLKGLAWRRNDGTESLSQLADVAPSWSWASVQGKLTFANMVLKDSMLKGPVLKIEHIDVQLGSAGKFGTVKGGHIRVEGQLQQVIVDRHQQRGARDARHHECCICYGFVNPTNVFCMLDEWDATLPRYKECYCLRLGSFNSAGREGDVYLLLDQIPGVTSTFRRIGFVRTDMWSNSLSLIADSGQFQASTAATQLVII